MAMSSLVHSRQVHCHLNYTRQGDIVSPPFVSLSVCLSVSTFTWRKSYWTDLCKNFTWDEFLDNELPLNFGSHSCPAPDLGIFKRIFNTAGQDFTKAIALVRWSQHNVSVSARLSNMLDQCPCKNELILKFQHNISRNSRVVVSVSTSRSRDEPTSRLGLVSRKIVNVSVSSRSREANVSVSSRAQPFTSRAQDQFSAKLCRPQYAVWALFRRCKPML